MVLNPIIHNISWVEPEINCYPSCLIDDLSSLNKNIKFKFWYVVQKEKENFNSRVDLVDQSLKYFYVSNKENLDEIINSDLLIIDGYRFCDKLLVFLRNKLNKPTIYLQHGRYTDLIRSFFSRHYFLKFRFYLRLLILSFFQYKRNTLEFIIKLLFLKEANNIKLGFIYSPLDYWQKYHLKKGFRFLENISIKDRDLNRFNLVESNEPYILYCLQSIYEDGRVNKIIFENFISELKRFSRNQNLPLKIKLHPRSNEKYVKKIFPDYEILNNKNIPRPLYVITHNSSIGTFFSANGIKVFCKRINNEKMPQGLLESKNIFCVESLEEIKRKKKFYESTKVDKNLMILSNQLLSEKINEILKQK